MQRKRDTGLQRLFSDKKSRYALEMCCPKNSMGLIHVYKPKEKGGNRGNRA